MKAATKTKEEMWYGMQNLNFLSKNIFAEADLADGRVKEINQGTKN